MSIENGNINENRNVNGKERKKERKKEKYIRTESLLKISQLLHLIVFRLDNSSSG
ncbi:MAG: hypothetical protein WAW23_00695 [Candidatus Methanoperedens sp.]